jgi:hypothetical protein
MQLINGIFPEPNTAVRASERAREVTRARSSIRVFCVGLGARVITKLL